ncbi:TPA: hypothetical protein I7730_16400 [Vibrio vulnificus]|uniref:Uncharacterized protein n=1 Tax=Vibrio vulnificus TaxID=672 RepID=A0A8H9N218_VIBVL|nr:hypothetical protein [Vibrio vulnificus]HAS8541366.1 hypothetical protein [Vibrio vulnificus]
MSKDDNQTDVDLLEVPIEDSDELTDISMDELVDLDLSDDSAEDELFGVSESGSDLESMNMSDDLSSTSLEVSYEESEGDESSELADLDSDLSEIGALEDFEVGIEANSEDSGVDELDELSDVFESDHSLSLEEDTHDDFDELSANLTVEETEQDVSIESDFLDDEMQFSDSDFEDPTERAELWDGEAAVEEEGPHMRSEEDYNFKDFEEESELDPELVEDDLAEIDDSNFALSEMVASAPEPKLKKNLESEALRQEEENNPEKIMQVNSIPDAPKKAGGSSMLPSILASLTTAFICLGGGFAGYKVFLEDQIISKQSLNAEMIAMKSKIEGSVDRKIVAVKQQEGTFVDSELFAKKFAELEAQIGSIVGLSDNDQKAIALVGELRNDFGDIKREQRDLGASLKRLSQMSIKAQGDDSGLSNEQLSKAIFAVLKKHDEYVASNAAELQSIMTMIDESGMESSKEISEFKQVVLEQLQVASEARDRMDRQTKALGSEVNLMKASRGPEATNAEQTIGDALGINVNKGSTPHKTYKFRGIMNGQLLVDVPVKGRRHGKIEPFSVGDFLDGYGEILSINKVGNKVMTESGLVRFSE